MQKLKISYQKESLKERIKRRRKVNSVFLSVFFHMSLEIVSYLPCNTNIFFSVVSFYLRVVVFLNVVTVNNK